MMIHWQYGTQSYPTDVSDDEWALVAPYLPRMTAEAPQRAQSVREVFHGLRGTVRAGAAWRRMPHALPPWHTVDQQRHRGLTAGVCAAIVPDLREVRRLAHGRTAQPSAAIFESRTVPSTPDSGTRAGDDGANAAGGRRGTWRWRRWGIGWHGRSPPPMRKTRAKSGRWPKKCKRCLATRSPWPLSTKATPGPTPLRRQRPSHGTGSGQAARGHKRLGVAAATLGGRS